MDCSFHATGTLTNKAQKAAKAERVIKAAARKVASEEAKARMLAAIAQKAAKQSSSMLTMLVVLFAPGQF